MTSFTFESDQQPQPAMSRQGAVTFILAGQPWRTAESLVTRRAWRRRHPPGRRPRHLVGRLHLRKVFCSVPSRLIGHQLRVRLYDDRLDLFIGGTPLMSLPRGRAHPSGKHAQVVNYRRVIHASRKKPMALLNLVMRPITCVTPVA